jgi:hypothetical protein
MLPSGSKRSLEEKVSLTYFSEFHSEDAIGIVWRRVEFLKRLFFFYSFDTARFDEHSAAFTTQKTHNCGRDPEVRQIEKINYLTDCLLCSIVE